MMALAAQDENLYGQEESSDYVDETDEEAKSQDQDNHNDSANEVDQPIYEEEQKEDQEDENTS